MVEGYGIKTMSWLYLLFCKFEGTSNMQKQNEQQKIYKLNAIDLLSLN